jgi:hypothetical protein
MITALGAACKANFSFISSFCNLNLNWHPAPNLGQHSGKYQGLLLTVATGNRLILWWIRFGSARRYDTLNTIEIQA